MSGSTFQTRRKVKAVLRRGSDVAPSAIRWLWNGWLPAGKLALIGGAPGTGKTTLALEFAATISRGRCWVDGSPCPRGSVVIWSGEDDHADTLNPRLRAAGADMRRVHVVEGVTSGARAYAFDPAEHIDALREALKDVPDVRLLIIDPIVSAIAADSHKNAEVRRSLQPIVDLAAELGIAILGVTHLSKGTAGRDPLERITGSLAFAALARVVLMTSHQSAAGERPERRLLVRAKSNLGPDGGGFAFQLEQHEVDGDPALVTSRVQWLDAVAGSARELLAESEGARVSLTGTLAAIEWLRGELNEGDRPAQALADLANSIGISQKVLRVARERLGVRCKRTGFGPGGQSVWSLPPYMPEEP